MEVRHDDLVRRGDAVASRIDPMINRLIKTWCRQARAVRSIAGTRPAEIVGNSNGKRLPASIGDKAVHLPLLQDLADHRRRRIERMSLPDGDLIREAGDKAVRSIVIPIAPFCSSVIAILCTAQSGLEIADLCERFAPGVGQVESEPAGEFLVETDLQSVVVGI